MRLSTLITTSGLIYYELPRQFDTDTSFSYDAGDRLIHVFSELPSEELLTWLHSSEQSFQNYERESGRTVYYTVFSDGNRLELIRPQGLIIAK